MTGTIAEAAVDYAKRGWKPVPVSRKTKKAIGKEWQKRPFDPEQFDGNGQNIAIQLGATSSGLTDVDLDTMTAIGLAPEFLPPTGAIFGRRSKPCSHQLYVTDLYQTEQTAVLQFKDSDAVIVELRIGGNGKGATTVLPPSMHSAGEMVEWVNDGEPARVAGADLKRAVLRLAVACLLKPRYPGNGSRHEGALVLGGVLARAGWNQDEIAHLVEVLARATNDDDIVDRVNTAVSAIEHKANGGEVPGLTRLGEVWGEDVGKTLSKWLNIRGPSMNTAPAGTGDPFTEDALALRFSERHADNLRYIATKGCWQKWDGARWYEEATHLAFDLARQSCRDDAQSFGNGNPPAGVLAAKAIAAVERMAKADRRQATVIEEWDADNLLFNTQEGD